MVIPVNLRIIYIVVLCKTIRAVNESNTLTI